MIAPVFVDVDVLLCARDAGEPVKQPLAADWMSRLWLEKAGRTSVQVLSAYYLAVAQTARPAVAPDDAWRDVKSLFAWRPQPTDASLLQCARAVQRRHRLSWNDSMVVAAAQLQDCALLLSAGFPDGAAYGPVTVRSPFTLSIDEPHAAYERASGVPRHPPRGRPRRATAGI